MTIVSISLLVNDTRVVLCPDPDGRFRLPKLVTHKLLTAKEVVEHPLLSGHDPVITTDKGEKFRVYQGGDPSQHVIQTISIIEQYDLRMSEKYKLKFGLNKTDIYNIQSAFPWDDYYGT